MKIYLHEKSIFNDVYWFAFNAFKLSGAELDAFIIYQALKTSKGLFGRNNNYFRTLTEILCTRSYQQILEIKKMYYKLYKMDLTDSICSKMKGSLRTFFYNVLTMSRYPRENYRSIDVRLFTEVIVVSKQRSFYKKNKEKFIEIFSRTNFKDIKNMITYLNEEPNGNITIYLKGILASRLRKCAHSICKSCFNSGQYCMDKEKYFAKCLNKYIRNSNIKGAISIILTRSEIDLADIIMEYQDLYKKGPIDDMLKLWDTKSKFINYFLRPLCQII
ncbi:Annexin D5 [Thelohanellus kitauei]|uniref:Annexin D5 n=1 Tax=Thelohanellus kitauei TaxID=669202 RepID=A0A0C2JU46_THEKT|nr:Annexin D5 [Thelohanellus kitauei]